MSAKLDALTDQIRALRAQIVVSESQLSPLLSAAQREQLREATDWARTQLPQLAHIVYTSEDGHSIYCHLLTDQHDQPIDDWETITTPDGQTLADAFPRIDNETPIDDWLTPNRERTWDSVVFDAQRIIGQAMTITTVGYMYRDESNFKVDGRIVLSGQITPQQVDQLRTSLHQGEQFIPTQVGLPHLGSTAEWPSFPSDDDHVWHEMNLDDIVTREVMTCVQPVSSVEEFVAAMTTTAGLWDDTVSVYDLV